MEFYNRIISNKTLMLSQENSSEEVSGHANNKNTAEIDSIEEIFYKQLLEYDEQHSGSNRKPWTQERIEEVIADLKQIKVTMKKKSVDYYWVGKYEVVTRPSEEFLTFKKKHPAEPTLRIVAREQYFDILSEIHTSCGHGGRDKMLHDIKCKYYIPKKAVQIFVSLCPVCESKRSGHKSDVVPRTIISRHLYERGHLDLINFQSCPDGEYEWLLSYQNLDTKFIILRPLRSARSVEVAYNLLSIFLTLGAPFRLQSHLEFDFMANVLDELAALWSDCKIVHESQDNAINNSTNIENLLHAWMNENNSTNWTVGCLFVQYYKNTSFHGEIGKFPYEASFGRLSKPGSFVSSTPISTIGDEEQLPISPEQQIANVKMEIKVENPDSENTESDENLEHKIIQNQSPEVYKCKFCNSTIHSIGGVIDDDQGQRLKVSCYVCKREQNVELMTNKGLKRAAEEIIDSVPKKIANLDIGHSVGVVVPKAYRGSQNIKTIKGKIVDFRNNVYRVATKNGTIKNWFSRHHLYNIETDYGEVLDTPISLEETVACQPASEGQRSQKCNCKPAVNQCQNNKCICYKSNVTCGSKCHQSLTCVNT